MLESWAASMVLKSHLTLVFMWHITFNLPATKITKYLLRLVAWNQPLKSTARLLTVVCVWGGTLCGLEEFLVLSSQSCPGWRIEALKSAPHLYLTNILDFCCCCCFGLFWDLNWLLWPKSFDSFLYLWSLLGQVKKQICCTLTLLKPESYWVYGVSFLPLIPCRSWRNKRYLSLGQYSVFYCEHSSHSHYWTFSISNFGCIYGRCGMVFSCLGLIVWFRHRLYIKVRCSSGAVTYCVVLELFTCCFLVFWLFLFFVFEPEVTMFEWDTG